MAVKYEHLTIVNSWYTWLRADVGMDYGLQGASGLSMHFNHLQWILDLCKKAARQLGFILFRNILHLMLTSSG